MVALADTPNALIQIGSVLLIKVEGVPLVRNLTQAELSYLQRNPQSAPSAAAPTENQYPAPKHPKAIRHVVAEHRSGGAAMLYHRYLAVLGPRNMATTHAPPQPGQTNTTSDSDLATPSVIEYVRPESTPSTYLDTATEPFAWPARHPGPSRTGRPWFHGGYPLPSLGRMNPAANSQERAG